MVQRLSLRGNRRLNHAIHLAAVIQIRHRHSPGQAYYDRTLEEAKTPKEAPRALKRRIKEPCTPPAGRHPAHDAVTNGSGGTLRDVFVDQRGRITPRSPAPRSSHSPDPTQGYDSWALADGLTWRALAT
jgi:hypothetical protein